MRRAILDETLSLLRRLVAFDTTSARSNAAMVADMAERLEAIGFRVELTWNPERTKANLLASRGPEAAGGLILSGHTDVVPVESQPWSSDPFACVERDGRLFGRGTADMKAFLACCMSVAADLQEIRLARPLHLAFSFDEEVGCVGVPLLIAAARERLRTAALCVVGEPTSMRVVRGHKGVYAFDTAFEGVECHSSDPDQGVSAVLHAVDFVHRLGGYFDALRAREHEQQVRPMTSFNVGILHGGSALNIVPRHCRALWEFRPSPHADAERIRGDLARLLDEQASAGVRAAPAIRSHMVARVPPLAPAHDHPMIDMLQATAGLEPGGVVDFGTEAGLFQEIGVPTIVCGPGSIEQAHRADEFVAVEQVDRCLDMLSGLVRQSVCP